MRQFGRTRGHAWASCRCASRLRAEGVRRRGGLRGLSHPTRRAPTTLLVSSSTISSVSSTGVRSSLLADALIPQPPPSRIAICLISPPHSTMNTVQDVAQYVAQHTAVLPGLLGYSMAARQSLKVRPSRSSPRSRRSQGLTSAFPVPQTFVATQAVGAPPKVSDADLAKMTWARRVGLLVGMLAVFSTEIYLLSTGDEHLLDCFFRYLFAFVYQLALMGVRSCPS